MTDASSLSTRDVGPIVRIHSRSPTPISCSCWSGARPNPQDTFERWTRTWSPSRPGDQSAARRVPRILGRLLDNTLAPHPCCPPVNPTGLVRSEISFSNPSYAFPTLSLDSPEPCKSTSDPPLSIRSCTSVFTRLPPGLHHSTSVLPSSNQHCYYLPLDFLILEESRRRASLLFSDIYTTTDIALQVPYLPSTLTPLQYGLPRVAISVSCRHGSPQARTVVASRRYIPSSAGPFPRSS